MKLNELKAWLSQLHPGLKSILNDDKYSWNWKDQGALAETVLYPRR